MNSIPKIRGFLAQKSNTAIFLYRESAGVTYLIHWDYKSKKNNISIGSRFFGKFYPNKCDLSHDGEDFLYFVMGNSQKKGEKRLFTWTAICKPPSIKAFWLLEHYDTWGGGGRFIGKQTIFIDAGNGIDKTNLKYSRYHITTDRPADFAGGYENSGFGWSIIGRDQYGIAIAWEKKCREILVIKFVRNDWINAGEYSMHQYQILDSSKTLLFPVSAAINWADFDNYGRLVIGFQNQLKIFEDISAIKNSKAMLLEINV